MPILNIVSTRRSLKSLLSPLITILMGGLVVLFCFRSFAVEPFDFDESIYRRMAEEMKAVGQWTSQPMFNGEMYNHKPPTFIGVLAFFSWILDGSDPQVTSFSSRFVSLLCSLLTAILIHRTWKRLIHRKDAEFFQDQHEFRLGISPVYFLLMCFLPTVASTAILLDPLLVLFTTLFVCCEGLRIAEPNRTLSRSFVLFFGSVLGMAGATATKGLIGLVLPAGSAVAFCLWQNKHLLKGEKLQFVKEVILQGARRFFPPFVVASLISALFYWYLWTSGGSAFVEEFFIRHHFGRATSAMEGHGGSIFYYIPVFVLGGGLTLSWLVSAFLIKNKSQEIIRTTEQNSLPYLASVKVWFVSWSLVCLAFFSLLATKLPNYIWPIWPAIALLAALGGLNRPPVVPRWFDKICFYLSAIVPFVLPFVFLTFAFTLLTWNTLFARVVHLKAREAAVLETILEHSGMLVLGFALSGVVLLFAAFLSRRWARIHLARGRMSELLSLGIARSLALLQVLACVLLMLFAVPAAEDILTTPIQQSTAKARMFLGRGEVLSTADLYSPNVVSSSRENVRLGIGDGEWIFTDPKTSVVLTPVWNLSACEKYGFDVAQGAEYFRICMRSYRKTLEGIKP